MIDVPFIPSHEPRSTMKPYEREHTFNIAAVRPVVAFDPEPIGDTGGFRMVPASTPLWEYVIDVRSVFPLGWYRLELLDADGTVRGVGEIAEVRWVSKPLDDALRLAVPSYVTPYEYDCDIQITLCAPQLLVFKPRLIYEAFEKPPSDKALAVRDPAPTLRRKK